MKIRRIYLYYSVIYLLMFFFTLTFNYVEGDDASTISHHALGKRELIQPAYSTYHSMFDGLLSIFNSTNEPFLRVFSISISFVFGYLFLISMIYLSKIKLRENFNKLTYFFVLLPFILPDLLFSSLILNPSLISITFIILSHIFLIDYLENKQIKKVLFSILFFGLGVSFRWSAGFYISILFAELMFLNANNIRNIINYKRLKMSIPIFSFYLISILFFIQLSGFSVFDIYNTYTSGKQYMTNLEISYLSALGGAMAFFTPALIILFLLGFYDVLKNKKYKPLFLLLFGVFPFLSLGLYPSFKYLITLVFPIILILSYGFLNLNKRWQKTALYIVIILPWFIGIQIKTTSSWGPGFEIKHKKTLSLNVDNYNPDKKIKFNNIQLVLGSGSAIPTSEGPRSLYGYGKVFSKDWKKLNITIEKEKNEAVNYALTNNIDILQESNHSLIIANLLEKGFYSDNLFWKNKYGDLRKRVFYKGKDSISIFITLDKKQLTKITSLSDVYKKNNEIVIYTVYTNIIAKLKTIHKENFSILGSYYGVLKNDLNERN